nr:hypothetical protein [Tanacetum cinerariifolium]
MARSGSTESGSRRGKMGVAGSLSGPHLVPQSSNRNVRRRVHTGRPVLNV